MQESSSRPFLRAGDFMRRICLSCLLFSLAMSTSLIAQKQDAAWIDGLKNTPAVGFGSDLPRDNFAGWFPDRVKPGLWVEACHPHNPATSVSEQLFWDRLHQAASSRLEKIGVTFVRGQFQAAARSSSEPPRGKSRRLYVSWWDRSPGQSQNDAARPRLLKP
jgi:hypothetical protein